MKTLLYGVIISVLGLSTKASMAQSYYWFYYTVDKSEPTGYYTAIVLDSLDRPCISYSKIFNASTAKSGLRFAKKTQTGWQTTAVQQDQGNYSSLALDPQGAPHITYNDNSGDLKHSYYQNNVWQTEIIDNYGFIFRDSFIRIDSNGHIHVSYYIRLDPSGRLANDLAYAFYDGATWHNTVVDSIDETGKWHEVALDRNGRPHISYVSQTFGNLRYAFMDDSGVWRREQIEETTGSNWQGYLNSIAIDANGVVHISFLSASTQRLKYAYGNFGNWKIEVVDTVAKFGQFHVEGAYTSLAVDRNNDPFISYFEETKGELRLAHRENGKWTISIVDSIGSVGSYSSLALNQQGLPVISYHDGTNQTLRLAIASLTPPPDSDADGIADYIEETIGLNSLDADTDDDGFKDGQEDANKNGLVEPGETDAKISDTDRDGLQDGTEAGLVNGIPASGGIPGTNLTLFVADQDPSTETNNLIFDSDSDGLGDGGEDKNANGRIDVDETDPSKPDTDADGLADGHETGPGLSPLDIDSDDDGLGDGTEDKNLNGILDADETDPARADTDGDGLADGLELGVTTPLADPDGSGRLLATNPQKFVPDADPSSKTDPRNADSDGDGLKDGEEDANQNGRLDKGETDPSNKDTDGDKLVDGIEAIAGTNPSGMDSDGDGIADGDEDLNQNGVAEANETAPRLFDSDEDGISDGVEQGKTVGISDPDGTGPLLGTDASVFIADSDPTVNSNPLLWDTDNDGLSDGEEDVNANGAVDNTETSFRIKDTDADGISDGDEVYFHSDPRNANSRAPINTLYKDRFISSQVQGWTIVDDGKNEGPSDWFTADSVLAQTSNIWGAAQSPEAEDPHKPGTYIWLNRFAGSQYKVNVKFKSIDDDELGIMFHYLDRANYYRFSMNKEFGYRRITKIVNGQARDIVTQKTSYQQNRFYELTLYVIDGNIQIYLDRRRVMAVQDQALRGGSIAFYCWKNAGAIFKNLSIEGQGQPVSVHEVIQRFSLDPQPDLNLIKWEISYHPSLANVSLFRDERSGFTLLETWPAVADAMQIVKGEYQDDYPLLAKGYRLIVYDANGQISDENKISTASDLTVRDFSLTAPYPNPASESSRVVLQAPQSVLSEYVIFNLLGRAVRFEKKELTGSGFHQIYWDGRDDQGRLLPPGVYFMRVRLSKINDAERVLWSKTAKIVRIP